MLSKQKIQKLKNEYDRPLWSDIDLVKFSAVVVVISFALGFLAGYEASWRPIVDCFRPLIG